MPSVALTTIRAVKDQPITYQPLMLARVVFTTTETAKAVTGATNASPIVVTSTAHGYTSGDVVSLYGVAGNTGANGRWEITVTGANTFSLVGSVGTGAYTSGGFVAKHKVLRLSTHGLRTVDGGFQYGGQDWLPRILNQDMAAAQALSEQGIDFTPSVTLKVADPDRFIWLNYAKTYGFKGATLEMVFIFWQVDSNTFSSDSITKFTGLSGDMNDGDDESFSITATNKMNMGSVELPGVRVQPKCPWMFPASAIERQQAADQEDSPFYYCGYSPDASGSNARGNYSSGVTPYVKCNYTKEDCVSRGMYTTDSSARQTGRFGGIQWSPPQTFISRGFISGKFEEIQNNPNETKYGDLVPLIYGTQRVDPLVLNLTGDANLTKMEVLICLGEIEHIHEVLINDQRIPHADNDSLFMSTVKEGGDNVKGFWTTVNRGSRNGAPNAGALYDGKGDPYGNYAVISVSVPKKIAEANALPRVQVHVKGPKIRVYSDATTWSLQYTENPAWVILDVLIWSNWRYNEIDIATFVAAAAKYDATISYKNQFGSTGSHARCTCSLTLRQRQTAADILRGLRNGCKSLLIPNYAAGGKLQLVVKETLASQQPADDLDSNYHSSVTSVLVSGSPGSGYVKWNFDESHYIEKNGKSTFKLFSRQDQSPNRFSMQFQNRDNRHATESVAVIDTEDVARVGRELNGSLTLLGVDNFDQLYRAVNTHFAEGYRGNSRLAADGSLIGDTGGTTMVEFETSFRVIHMRVGDICRVNNQQWGIVNQLVRLTKLQPTTNWETAKLTFAFHNDLWYRDDFGQSDAPRFRPGYRNRLERASFPWAPYGEQPNFDAWLSNNDWSFSLKSNAETMGDGSAIQKLEIGGRLPINTFASEPEPPFVAQQGSTASTGGSLAGDKTYFLAVCSKNVVGSDYKLSAPSALCTVAVPAGTATNTVTATGLVWGTGAVGYILFAGTDPNKLTYQSDGDTTPTSLTLTSYKESTWPMPDIEFDHMRFRVKRVLHSGVWGAEVVSCSDTGLPLGAKIKVAVLPGTNAGFTTNQWAGYDCSLLGMVNVRGSVPIANWTVVSNTADELVVNPGPSPTGIERRLSVNGSVITTLDLGLMPGDVIVMRSKPTVGSDAVGNYVEDAGWINNLGQLEDSYLVTAASNATPIVITTSSNHPYTTGEKVYVSGVEGNTNANGLWVVTVLTATTFSLNTSVGSAAYTAGGAAQRMIQGLIDGEEKGRILRIIHGPGKGTFVKIKDNMEVSGVERIYIEGDWPVTPTSASRYIIEEATWQIVKDTESFNNSDPTTEVSMAVDVNNYVNQMLLVQTLTVDGGETPSSEYNSPIREIWNYGSAGAINFTGAVFMNIDGNIAIGSDQAPRIQLSKDTRAVAVKAMVKTMPTGASMILDIIVNGTSWMTLIMAAGTSIVSASGAQINNATTLTAGSDIKLDVVAVGTTNPGADLSVIIYV